MLKQKEPCHVQQITQLLQLWDSQELLVPEEPQAPSTAPAQPYLQSFSSSFDSSVQQKNLPLKSCTAMTAKMNMKSMQTMRMLRTFFREFTTQSKTAWGWEQGQGAARKAEGTQHLPARGSSYPTHNPRVVSLTCTAHVWCMLAVGNNSGFLQLLLSWWVWCATEFSGAARKIHQDREILVLSKYSHGQL